MKPGDVRVRQPVCTGKDHARAEGNLPIDLRALLVKRTNSARSSPETKTSLFGRPVLAINPYKHDSLTFNSQIVSRGLGLRSLPGGRVQSSPLEGLPGEECPLRLAPRMRGEVDDRVCRVRDRHRWRSQRIRDGEEPLGGTRQRSHPTSRPAEVQGGLRVVEKGSLRRREVTTCHGELPRILRRRTKRLADRPPVAHEARVHLSEEPSRRGRRAGRGQSSGVSGPRGVR